MEQLHELVVERGGFPSRLLLGAYDLQCRRDVARLQSLPQCEHGLERGQAHDLGHRALVHRTLGEGAHAIEQRERVAQASLGGTCDQLRRTGRELEAFLLRNPAETRHHQLERESDGSRPADSATGSSPETCPSRWRPG